MILTHESGAQEDQFDEKKWRLKISWYYPFKFKNLKNLSCIVSHPQWEKIIFFMVNHIIFHFYFFLRIGLTVQEANFF